MTTRDEFLEGRKTGIGGSDAAAMLGISRYRTPGAIYRQKVGIDGPAEDNEAMAIGRALEPFVIQMYEREMGVTVQRPKKLIRHPKYPHLIANVDGLMPQRVIEAKVPFDNRDWGIEGTNDIPVDYFVQTQHYMLVTGLPEAHVPVFFRGLREHTFRIYVVQADLDFQERIIEESIPFWQHVQQRIEPDPISFEEMQMHWTKMLAASKSQNVRLATPELITAVSELKGIREDLKVLEVERERLENVVKVAMADADVLLHDGKPLATWKLTKARTMFDSKRLEIELPELFAQYKREGNASRMFLVK